MSSSDIATFGQRRPIGNRIDRLLGPVAAALLGAASAFFCFAMPAAIVSGIVRTLGLPPALAESRLALAIGIGLVFAAATWFGFAALDRAARPRPARFGAPEGETDLPPVLRRADAHPDAPPRRPIFAGSDLGTPLDLIDPLPADWAAPRRPTMPVTIEDAEFHVVETIDTGLEPEPLPAAPAATVAPFVRTDTTDYVPSGPAPTLAAMMARLESGLVRKSLALAGAEPNVTALKREIRPVGGSLRAAVDELHDRTAARR